jgi:hypothetical protein
VAHVPPPQSTSVSEPFFRPSLHVGVGGVLVLVLVVLPLEPQPVTRPITIMAHAAAPDR